MNITDEIHQKILQVVSSEISITTLAKSAGISRKTLYNYINSKEATLNSLRKICSVPIIKDKL